MEYSAQQLAAIHATGHTLVTACPGAGKTRVIIQRSIELLKNPSNKLALVTFTRAAADEMRSRIAAQTKSTRLVVKTFHAYLCAQHRSLHSKRKLIGNVDRRNLIFQTINMAEETFSYEAMQEIIESHGANLYPDDLKNKEPDAWHAYSIYRHLLTEHNYIDLPGICRDVVLALREGVLNTLPITHLLVDEFQDIDDIQLAWVTEHVKRGVQVTVVADDDQSIYAFRHSLGYTGLQRFQHIAHPTQVVLDTCYRCPEDVLDAADALISQNHDRHPKQLVSATGEAGTLLQILCINDKQEAEVIAAQLPTHKGTKAVLARSNAQLDKIEAVLRVAGLTYQRLSGRTFWENQVCTLFLGFIQSLENPQNSIGIQSVMAYLGVKQDAIARYVDLLRANTGVVPTQTLSEAGLPETLQAYNEILMTYKTMQQDGETWQASVLFATNWLISRYKKVDNDYLFQRRANTTTIAADAFCSVQGDIEDVLQKLLNPRPRPAFDHDNDQTIYVATFHAAKGLEFDTVWIKAADVDTKNIEPPVLEEERRLFYVAMTRTKSTLYISYIEKPPAFLQEIATVQKKKKKTKPAQNQQQERVHA